MNLNNRVQKIIEYSMLTASEFADEIGVQRSNISHIISERNKPSLDFLMKIKERFPEIKWEWIIEGKGDMTEHSPTPLTTTVESKMNTKEDNNKTIDLFTLSKSEEVISKPNIEEIIMPSSNPREFDISNHSAHQEKIENSQELEFQKDLLNNQNTDNQGNKIKKIVFFYENGKFEIFEP